MASSTSLYLRTGELIRELLIKSVGISQLKLLSAENTLCAISISKALGSRYSFRISPFFFRNNF